MKKIILISALLLGMEVVHAQINDVAFAAVKYSFRHVTDTTDPANPYTETMVLQLGKEYSVYKSYDKIKRDSILYAQLEAQMKIDPKNISIGTPGMKPVSQNAFYKEVNGQNLYRIENLYGLYLIQEPAAVINWTISTDTKKIGSLDCQKATTHFKGRDYTAWFCSQLPYSNGPWKLGGLPGLILEAYDDKNEVNFSFESFEDVTQRNVAITVPERAVKASQAEFKQLTDAAKKDPKGFMTTQMAASGISVLSSASANGGPVTKRKTPNNPIEKNND